MGAEASQVAMEQGVWLRVWCALTACFQALDPTVQRRCLDLGALPAGVPVPIIMLHRLWHGPSRPTARDTTACLSRAHPASLAVQSALSYTAK